MFVTSNVKALLAELLEALGRYMLSTRIEAYNTVFYLYLACFINTLTLNMYVSMSYTGITFYSYLACFMKTLTLNMYVSMSYTGITRRNT